MAGKRFDSLASKAYFGQSARLIGVSVWFTVVATACAPTEPDPVDTGDSDVVESCGADKLEWDSFAEPFFVVWCTSCHSAEALGERRYGAPEGVNFDTYEGALQWTDRIRARAVDSADMPVGGYGPSPEERIRLGDWLDCGTRI